MDIKVAFSEHPEFVLKVAREFLASQPVLHYLILSLLHSRITHCEPGRYWSATDGGRVVGVAVQSPLTFPATLTPMECHVVNALVDAIAEMGISLPGVNGGAATAASFAGHWTERCKSAARPIQGNRLCELLDLAEAPSVGGKLRQATLTYCGLMIEWTGAFQDEIGEPANDTALRVDRALAAGQLWLWDDGEAVSMTMSRDAVEGVVRLSGVYTPTHKRECGYASACVHAVSKNFHDAGYRCILYTDIANHTSNSIYRCVGYRAVAEAVRYRFG